MKAGTFIRKPLSDYFKLSTTDWVNARRIVNGTDRAADIAKFAQLFYAALKGLRDGRVLKNSTPSRPSPPSPCC
jgi:putative chitinase